MNEFNSNIDSWLAIIIFLAVVSSIVIGIFQANSSITAMLISFSSAGFIISLIIALAFPCKYVLKQDHLLIKSGLFYRQHIPYSRVENIELSSNPISAPALSLKRVKITFGRRFQLVSPQNREEFIIALRERVFLARQE